MSKYPLAAEWNTTVELLKELIDLFEKGVASVEFAMKVDGEIKVMRINCITEEQYEEIRRKAESEDVHES